MFLKPALTVNTYRHSYQLSLYVTLATLGSNTGACIYVKNMVKMPEILISVETDFNPRNEISVFHSFSPLARRPGIGAFRAFKPYF